MCVTCNYYRMASIHFICSSVKYLRCANKTAAYFLYLFNPCAHNRLQSSWTTGDRIVGTLCVTHKNTIFQLTVSLFAFLFWRSRSPSGRPYCNAICRLDGGFSWDRQISFCEELLQLCGRAHKLQLRCGQIHSWKDFINPSCWRVWQSFVLYKVHSTNLWTTLYNANFVGYIQNPHVWVTRNADGTTRCGCATRPDINRMCKPVTK